MLLEKRSDLDDALSSKVSVCVLLGAEDTKAGAVHGFLEPKTWGNLPWQTWFLVTDLLLLTEEEREEWFGADRDYVFLGRNSKVVTGSGLCEKDLLLKSGACYFGNVQRKFAQADLQ